MAASLTIWLKAGWMKSANWISQIGRMPYSAAPMPTPTIESSASGESITRSGAVLLEQAQRGAEHAAAQPTSSPTMKTRVVAGQFLVHRLADRLDQGHLRHRPPDSSAYTG